MVFVDGVNKALNNRCIDVFLFPRLHVTYVFIMQQVFILLTTTRLEQQVC